MGKNMLMLLGTALAEPCQFSGLTPEMMDAEDLAAAWDNDESTWTSGTAFALGLTLVEDQLVERVGIAVQTDEEVTYDLDIWYVPPDETTPVELFSDNGSLPAGENRGTWEAGVLAEELYYSVNTSATGPVGFQVVCSSSEYQEYTVRGGGGCSGGGQFGLSGAWFLGPSVLMLRRQRKPLK